MRRLFLLISFLAIAGCADPIRSTQVMAIIDAEEAVLPHIAKVKLTVYGSGEGEPPIPVLIEDVSGPDFPIQVAMVPLGDDASRIFGIEARAFDNENQPQLISRARGTYVENDARTVYLRFDEACLGVLTCGADETCSLGLCVESWVPTDRFGRLDQDGAVPTPPVPVVDEYTTTSHEAITFDPAANDFNPAGGALELVSVREVDVARGTFQILPSGEVEFAPVYLKPGLARAIYTVRNSEGAVADGLIRIEVDFAGSSNVDSDGDGIPDAIEVASGCLDPFDSDTDDDGIPDGVEDYNKNGVVDLFETDPCSPDTDGDGLCDGQRVDNDGDGVIDPPSSCTGQDVMYIVQDAPGGDGLTWATAFGSLDQARAAPGAWVEGREFHIAGGLYAVGELLIDKDMLELHGGFIGNELSRAARVPFQVPTVLTGITSPATESLKLRIAQNVEGVRFSQLALSGDLSDSLMMLEEGSIGTLIDGVLFTRGGSTGAALVMESVADVRVQNSLFFRNASGAISITGSKAVQIDRSVFSENKRTTAGGTISAQGSELSVDRTRFSANTGGGLGGVILFQGTHHEAHRFSLRNSVINHVPNAPSEVNPIRLLGTLRASLENLSIVERGQEPHRPAIIVEATAPTSAITLSLLHVSHTTNLVGAEDDESRLIDVTAPDGAVIDIEALNVVTKLENLAMGGGMNLHVIDGGTCLGANPKVAADLQVLLNDETNTCVDQGAEVGRSRLADVLGVPVEESIASFAWEFDTGVIDPGYHLTQRGPVVAMFEYLPSTPGNRWRAVADHCLLFSADEPLAGLISVPREGTQEMANFDSILCFGEGAPSLARAVTPP